MIHNFEQSQDPGLTYEEGRELLTGYIGHGPGHFEEMPIAVGVSEDGKWDVLWQLDENGGEDPIPLAWVEAGQLKGKDLAIGLVRAWFIGLREGQGATEPPYDEVLRISRPLTKADLSKLTREIFG